MAESFSVLLLLFLTLTRCPSYCRQDKENKEDKKRFGASIVHGEPAPIGRFPYMCSLRKRGNREHRCGGTLIRSKWVLTAAHCIDPGFRDSVGLTPVVYCGAYTSETNDLDFIFTAVEGHVHSSWTGDTDDGYDVGLLKLDRKSKAPLPGIDTQNTPIGSGEVLTALGWGRTDSQEIADTLQMAQHLHYVSPARCEQEVGDIFKEHMICAGLLNEDTCKGDSGGPLLIPDGPDGNITAGIPQTDLIVGVTSFGPEACDASVPGVYIRISYIWEWVLEVLDMKGNVAATGAHSQMSSPADEEPPTESPAAEEDLSNSNGSEADPEIEPETEDEGDGSNNKDDSDDVKKAFDAIKNGDAALLERLLLEGLDPNSIYSDASYDGAVDDTLLHWAARFQTSECARVLIENGAELEERNVDGETPLHICAREGSTHTAKVLLWHHADVSATNKDLHTPVHLACIYGRNRLIDVLIEHGADVDATDYLGETPLHDAAANGKTKAVKILLNSGANIEARDEEGFTPLHSGCFNGRVEVVKILLDSGADMDTRSNLYSTPLHETCIAGHYGVAQVLIERGADVAAEDMLLITPLHEAAIHNHPDIVEILMKNGADIEIKEMGGRTPLHFASTNGSFEAVEVLLENGANVSATDILKNTPLHEAARHNHPDIVEILLKNGADIEVKRDVEGWTPLHSACFYGSFEAVEVLLGKGAEVDARSDAGWTPLHEACLSGNEDVVEILLNEGADMDAVDDSGQTPLHKAAAGGHLHVAEVLIGAGASKYSTDNLEKIPYDTICNENDDCTRSTEKSLNELLSP